eukprot:2328908-Pyramimonas_sp.AAC.1
MLSRARLSHVPAVESCQHVCIAAAERGLGPQEASPGLLEVVVESLAPPFGCHPPGSDVCKGGASPAPEAFIWHPACRRGLA